MRVAGGLTYMPERRHSPGLSRSQAHYYIPVSIER